MYFTLYEKMLEVCFSTHPNIYYRTLFPSRAGHPETMQPHATPGRTAISQCVSSKRIAMHRFVCGGRRMRLEEPAHGG